jgi:WD40 repeat protein
VEGLLATSSYEQGHALIKIWSYNNNQFQLLNTIEIGNDQVASTAFHVAKPWIAASQKNNKLGIYDCLTGGTVAVRRK